MAKNNVRIAPRRGGVPPPMLIQEFRGIDSSKRALRSFGLVVGALVALILYWRHDWTARPLGVWLAAVGAVLIIMGAAAPIDTDETCTG